MLLATAVPLLKAIIMLMIIMIRMIILIMMMAILIGDHHAPGNYGLLDMAMAIKWVYDNVYAFQVGQDNFYMCLHWPIPSLKNSDTRFNHLTIYIKTLIQILYLSLRF